MVIEELFGIFQQKEIIVSPPIHGHGRVKHTQPNK